MDTLANTFVTRSQHTDTLAGMTWTGDTLTHGHSGTHHEHTPGTQALTQTINGLMTRL